MRKSTQGEALARRNAIMALYLGLVQPRDIEKKFPGATRPRVQSAVKAMGPGLRQNADYREVERAANAQAGVDEARGAYTNHEFNEGMVKRITGSTVKEVTQRYVKVVYRCISCVYVDVVCVNITIGCYGGDPSSRPPACAPTSYGNPAPLTPRPPPPPFPQPSTAALPSLKSPFGSFHLLYGVCRFTRIGT